MGWIAEDTKKNNGDIKKAQKNSDSQQRPFMDLMNVDQELKARAQEKDRLIELAKHVDTKLERELAEMLYNKEEVREAGKKAFSRVSTLLIRFRITHLFTSCIQKRHPENCIVRDLTG